MTHEHDSWLTLSFTIIGSSVEMIVDSVIVTEWLTTTVMLSPGEHVLSQNHRNYNEHKFISEKSNDHCITS